MSPSSLLPESTLRRQVQTGTLVALPLHGCQLVRPLGIKHVYILSQLGRRSRERLDRSRTAPVCRPSMQVRKADGILVTDRLLLTLDHLNSAPGLDTPNCLPGEVMARFFLTV
jgi:hypothetical protein